MSRVVAKLLISVGDKRELPDPGVSECFDREISGLMTAATEAYGNDPATGSNICKPAVRHAFFIFSVRATLFAMMNCWIRIVGEEQLIVSC